MTKEERDLFLKTEAKNLLKAKRHKISLEGLKAIPKEAGCYVLYYENEVVYVGESTNLHGRLLHLRNGEHTARKSIASLIMKTDLDEKDKKITDFIEKKMEVAFLVTDLDRKKLEGWLIKEKKPILNQ